MPSTGNTETVTTPIPGGWYKNVDDETRGGSPSAGVSPPFLGA